METRDVAQLQLSHADIWSQIPCFSGEGNEDVISWTMPFDEVQAAYNVNPSVIKVLATRQFTGKVKEWYNRAPD